MQPIQILLLVVFGVMGAGFLAATVRGRLGAFAGVFWTLVFALACAATIWPKLTSTVAGWLGIGRGTDLVLYALVVATIVGFFMMYLRIQRLRREITVLVRRLAIHEGERVAPDDQPGGSA